MISEEMKDVAQGIKELRLLGYALWIEEDDVLNYRRVHRFRLDKIDLALADSLLSFIGTHKSLVIECLRKDTRGNQAQLLLSDPLDFDAMFKEACENLNQRYLKAGINSDNLVSLTTYIENNHPDLVAMIAEKEMILNTIWKNGQNLGKFKQELLIWHSLRIQELKYYIYSTSASLITSNLKIQDSHCT